MLSKKYYRGIAEVVKKARTDGCWVALVDALAQYFKEDNPSFDVEKWKKALEGGNK